MNRGRPKKALPTQRVELRLLDDEMYATLEEEARLRNVSVQQHCHDIIRARWLAQQGRAIDLAGETTAEAITSVSTSDHHTAQRAA